MLYVSLVCLVHRIILVHLPLPVCVQGIQDIIISLVHILPYREFLAVQCEHSLLVLFWQIHRPIIPKWYDIAVCRNADHLERKECAFVAVVQEQLCLSAGRWRQIKCRHIADRLCHHLAYLSL